MKKEKDNINKKVTLIIFTFKAYFFCDCFTSMMPFREEVELSVEYLRTGITLTKLFRNENELTVENIIKKQLQIFQNSIPFFLLLNH